MCFQLCCHSSWNHSTAQHITGDMINGTDPRKVYTDICIQMHAKKSSVASATCFWGRSNWRVELDRAWLQLLIEPVLQTQEFIQSGWFRGKVSSPLARNMPSAPHSTKTTKHQRGRRVTWEWSSKQWAWKCWRKEFSEAWKGIWKIVMRKQLGWKGFNKDE